MTMVILRPKSTESVAPGNTPAAFHTAINDSSTGGTNGYGHSVVRAQYSTGGGSQLVGNFTYGLMQSLDDIGAPVLKIISVSYRCQGSINSSSNTWNSFLHADSIDQGIQYNGISAAGNNGQEIGSIETTKRTFIYSAANPGGVWGPDGVKWQRSDFTHMNWVAYSGNFSGDVPTENHYWYYDQLEVELADIPPASTALTPASGSTVTTGKPTVGLTVTKAISSQKVKGQWQFATDSAFTLDVVLATESDVELSASTHVTTEILTESSRLYKNGLWYFRGRTIDEYGQTGPWTSANTLTVNVAAPPVPTGILPIAGATINTDVPVLQATVTAAADGQTSRIDWQVATDAGFTVGLKTISESILRLSGTTTFTTPDAQQFTQRLWYIRARQVDIYGSLGTWSAGTSFTVTHPPIANNLTPTGAISAAYGATTPLAWFFGDTSPVDSQTAYQIIIERNDTNALVLDTGKVSSAQLTTAPSISSTLKDIQLRWKIQLWDTDDVTGGYGGYAIFTLSDRPTVVITSPANLSTIQSGRPALVWTFTASGGRTQAKYQIVYTKQGAGAPAYDTGLVDGSALAYTPPVLVMRNNETFNIVLTVTDTVGITQTQTVTVTASYVVPDVVTYSLDASNYASGGNVRITWLNIADSAFLRWRIYRRVLNSYTQFAVIGEVTSNSVNEYLDWMAPSGYTYEYFVVQIVDRFGEEVESSIPSVIQTVTLISGDYWLIDPLEPSNNLRLSVKSDSFTDEIEQNAYNIVGRGRHVDYGDELGVSGSLVAQLRDDSYGTARDKQIKIKQLRIQKRLCYLRNPFGDVIAIAIGNASIDRMAGVGTSEFCDVTIPYLEVS